jgi:hypothetical protein
MGISVKVKSKLSRKKKGKGKKERAFSYRCCNNYEIKVLLEKLDTQEEYVSGICLSIQGEVGIKDREIQLRS